MLDSFFFYGAVVALVLLTAFGLVTIMRYHGPSANLMKSAHMMESRVYKAVAEKYGAEPSLVAACLTPEGEAIIGAMTRCDRCGSVEECRHFFDQPESDVDEAREFCPNVDLLIELAEKLRREAKC
ncbi:MAG: DUF6455 family protein [Woeseiaceae bacterium]